MFSYISSCLILLFLNFILCNCVIIFQVVINCLYTQENPIKAKKQGKQKLFIYTLSLSREKKKLCFVAPAKMQKGESDPNSPSCMRLQGKLLLKRSCFSTSFRRGDELSSQQKLSLHRALSLSKNLILIFFKIFVFLFFVVCVLEDRVFDFAFALSSLQILILVLLNRSVT